MFRRGFPGDSVVKNPSATAGDVKDVSLIPGLGRSPGGGHGNPLQYSCLENPRHRGAWRVTELDATEAAEHTHAHGVPCLLIFKYWSGLDPRAKSHLVTVYNSLVRQCVLLRLLDGILITIVIKIFCIHSRIWIVIWNILFLNFSGFGSGINNTGFW